MLLHLHYDRAVTPVSITIIIIIIIIIIITMITTFIYTAQIQLYSFQMRLTIKDKKI